ncbi:MCE family protein [Saccharopolyspora spinosa]|uniref:Phospholipid/cholesterol/gamma-HCH transport system substrate-binding protein n=1 Tax=Saccharopolyspora spinosa TaxID=60894 RepID=A0A2N3Y3N9_SACSN|nr:MCE family protein [Saccharopolyspora spinosa]PKW17517.1 phospholipid/cholesterol/gamma-HCH transport system substrate-binding protein [Saccharopolyspora spinosa]
MRKVLVNGAIGAVVVLLLLAGSIAVPRVLFLLRTNEYHAEFGNAAGLEVGTQVMVAGVPAGRVTEVALAGDRVRVSFRLDDAHSLGRDTRAAIKLRTVLGTRYLSVESAGPARLSPGGTIPLSHTSVPYSLDELQSAAKSTAEGLDLPRLRAMIDAVDEVSPDDPQLLGNVLDGIATASAIVGERGEQMQELLRGTRMLTTTLVEQQDTLVTLLGDAQLIVDTLQQRRTVIRQLSTDVHTVVDQLERLLRENRDVLDPLLADLHALTDSLERNDLAIDESLRRLGPASRYLANATGNGPWGEVSAPLGPVPDNVLCVAGLFKRCR